MKLIKELGCSECMSCKRYIVGTEQRQWPLKSLLSRIRGVIEKKAGIKIKDNVSVVLCLCFGIVLVILIFLSYHRDQPFRRKKIRSAIKENFWLDIDRSAVLFQWMPLCHNLHHESEAVEDFTPTRERKSGESGKRGITLPLLA